MMIPYRVESPTFSYMQCPRYLFEGMPNTLSNDAKLLYVLMLDRVSISGVNGFLNKDGSIRVYYTIDEIRSKLNCGKEKAISTVRELEKAGLVLKKRQGQGRANIITLCYPDDAKEIQKKEEINDPKI